MSKVSEINVEMIKVTLIMYFNLLLRMVIITIKFNNLCIITIKTKFQNQCQLTH